jgi:hypothetical protein
MSMQDWIGLCTAAGINVRNMDEMDVFLTAGRILNDRELTARCLAFVGHGDHKEILRLWKLGDANNPNRVGGHLGSGTRDEVLEAMPVQDRLALRERVTGVVQMPVRKTT